MQPMLNQLKIMNSPCWARSLWRAPGIWLSLSSQLQTTEHTLVSLTAKAIYEGSSRSLYNLQEHLRVRQWCNAIRNYWQIIAPLPWGGGVATIPATRLRVSGSPSLGCQPLCFSKLGVTAAMLTRIYSRSHLHTCHSVHNLNLSSRRSETPATQKERVVLSSTLY
jgi:hypothetical protein